MAVVILVFAVGLLIGLPICLVLGVTGVTHLIAIGNASFFNVITQRLFAGMDVGGLTCIPFFIIAGEMMNVTGVTGKLLDFVRDLVGHLRGGLAYAVVLIAMILSAILGSPNAVAAILCAIIIPEMLKDGYPEDFGGALIASSGILGPVIPPSTFFVQFSVLSGVSVGALFMGGVIPGVMLGAAFCVVIARYVRKYDLPSGRPFEWKRLLKSTVSALPALLVPFIIIGGILRGVFTPTESGAVAVFAAFVAGCFYRKMKLSALPGIFFRSALSTAGIFIIIGFGNIMGWTMAIDKIPERLSAAILSMTDSRVLITLLILAILIVVGCVMEATAAMVIFTPVLLPLAVKIGMDPVHFGVVFCIMLTIGLVTPPVGMTLFVTSNISGIPLKRLSRTVVPFVIAAFLATLIMAFVPQTVTMIPSLLGFLS